MFQRTRMDVFFSLEYMSNYNIDGAGGAEMLFGDLKPRGFNEYFTEYDCINLSFL